MFKQKLLNKVWQTSIAPFFISLGISVITITPAMAELSVEEVNSVARQTTVLIAPGLTPEFIQELEENRNNPLASKSNPDGVWNPGSGVIIGRERDTYYVLTVSHNFKQRYLELNVPHGIRTSDGQVHLVEQVNDGRNCPLQGVVDQRALIRFGCYSLSVPGGVDGTDLAVITFKSDQEYPIASLGSPENVAIGDRVYLSGWPDPEKEKDPVTGRCKGKVARRKRRLAWTPVTRKIPIPNSENGYNLFYFDLTRPGMSGGPVFDANGLVVGVHGRGSADKGKLLQEYCSLDLAQGNKLALESGDFLESNDLERVVQAAVNYTPPLLHTEFSSGQSSNNFLNLWQNLDFNLLFNRQPPTRELIDVALTSIEQDDTNSGVFDVAANEDLTGSIELQAEEDVVEDIYEGFSLSNLLRDEPSPGCEFLLLGDPCDS